MVSPTKRFYYIKAYKELWKSIRIKLEHPLMDLKQSPTYFAAISCYLGAFTVGYIIGFPSPTQKELIDENIIDYQTLPIYASISYITNIIGYMTSPILVLFGISNKTSAILSCILGVTGYMLVTLASSSLYVIAGLGLVGVYSGIILVSIMIYVTEVSLDNQRKVMSGGFGFCIRIGLFIGYFAGIWLSFRWLAVFGISLTCVFCCLLVINPNSPVWYVQQGLEEKAKSTLLYLHGREFDADSEMENIKEKTLSNNISCIESIRALKNWKVLKPILIMVGITFLKELGGHEAMVAFSSHILTSQQAIDPKVASLFYPLFLIAGAILCVLIHGYTKMKWLLITASIFQAMSHMSMAIYYLVSEHFLYCNTEYTQLCRSLAFWPILNIAIYAFSFGLGWGLVFFALLGTLFTVHKEFSGAIIGVVANISSYSVILLFFYSLHNVGGCITFLILSVNYLIAIGYAFFILKT